MIASHPGNRAISTEPNFSGTDVINAAVSYFDGDELAADVWASKYALRVSEEIPTPYCELSPDDTIHRVASELHRIERKYPNPLSYEDIYEALDHFRKVVPQGSPLTGIGNPHSLLTLSNCVVGPSPADSMTGISNTGRALMHLYKRRAGVGIAIDGLRPELMKTNNASRWSTGPVSYCHYYSHITRLIGQKGRRGALMITMNVRHPDVFKFAAMKQDLESVTGANVSTMLSDEFFRAVHERDVWTMAWKKVPNGTEPTESIDVSDEEIEEFLAQGGRWENELFEQEHRGTALRLETLRWVSDTKDPAMFVRRVDAAELYRFICTCTWLSGDPGILLWDTYKANLPAHEYSEFKTVSTNPCSEIGLSVYDSCRLLTVCLVSFVKNPFTESSYFDLEEFGRYVRIAMRLMDDIVDLEIECLERIIAHIDDPDESEIWEQLLKSAVRGRRTGIGVHGLGETLARLRTRYGDDDSIEQVDSIYSALRDSAYRESVELARERGTFPAYNAETEADNVFLARLPEDVRRDMAVFGRRNISVLTGAPTGSMSILSRCTSGIEAAFRFAYVRRRKGNPGDTNFRADHVDNVGDVWQNYVVFEKFVEDYLRSGDGWERYEEFFEQNRTLEPTRLVAKTSEFLKTILPEYFIEADSVEFENRIRLQGAAQRYIDHGISSTINLPNSATIEDVERVFVLAHQYGLKGLTVFRDGCRPGVLVSGDQHATDFPQHNAPKRPEVLECNIHRTTIEKTPWVIIVGLMQNKPYEVFGGPIEAVSLPKKFRHGRMLKRRCTRDDGDGPRTRSCYDLILGDDDDPLILKDIGSMLLPGDCEVTTRLISTSLRHGVEIGFVVDQLRVARSQSLHSFGRAMARVLSEYVLDPETGLKRDNCRSGNCD